MKPSGDLKRFLEAKKKPATVVPTVERMLLGRDPWDMHQGNGEVVKRRWDKIHPSELAGNDWCPRAAYYRISRGPVDVESHRFQTEVIFEEGHEYHRKWQAWLWDRGILRGRFNCVACMENHETFTAVAPTECPNCGRPRRALEYREVPLRKDSHLITGSSDGDLVLGDEEDEDPLLEVKSIGMGTVRMENPALLGKHSHKVDVGNGKTKTLIDIESLWRDIRRPFPNHLRQGLIYCWVLGRKRIIFIYELKNDGRTKEFEVKANSRYIADLLDECLDVKYALEAGRPPPCKKGKKRCQICKAYEEAEDASEETSEPRRRGSEGEDRGRRRVVRRSRAQAPAEAEERREASEPARRHRRSRRPRVDAAHDSTGSLVGMARRSTDAGRDRDDRGEGATRSGEEHRPARGKRRVVRQRH